MFTYLQKCNAILKWAETQAPNFNTNWTLDIKHDLDFFGEALEPKQKKGIDNIIDKFHIKVCDWL